MSQRCHNNVVISRNDDDKRKTVRFLFFKLQIYSSDLNWLRSTSQTSPSLAFTLVVSADDADASYDDNAASDDDKFAADDDNVASYADARQALSV